MEKNPAKSTALALTTVAVWSTVASAFKLSLRHVDHVQLLFWSCLVSVCVLGLVRLVQSGKQSPRPILSTADLRISAVLGFFNPFAYYLILFKAYDLLPAQEAQILNYTWGITLALLSVPLLRQRMRAFELAGIVVSYLGVLVVSTHGRVWSLEFENPLGVGLALGSTVIWSLYWIFNTRDALDPVSRLFLNFCFGLIYAGIWTIFFSDFSFGGLAGLAGCAYVGAFEMGISFVLWLTAMRLAVSTARISHYIYLSPFLSLVFIHFLVGEKILPSTLAGLVLILAGLGVKSLGPRPGKGKKA
jgi:drug/metabolite transporter (DMT)-like permease